MFNQSFLKMIQIKNVTYGHFDGICVLLLYVIFQAHE